MIHRNSAFTHSSPFMKPTLSILTAACLVTWAPLLYADENGDGRQNTPPRFNTLVTMATQVDSKTYQDFLEAPTTAPLLYRWVIESSVPEDTLKDLNKSGIINRLFSDTVWMEGLLNSGPIPNIELALANLAFLCEKDKQAIVKPIYKKLATAFALEYARQADADLKRNSKKKNYQTRWSQERMLQYYTYFRTSHAKGLLNPVFDTLDFWDMRILAGRAPGDWIDTESLEWMRDNVRLPAQQYTGACWQAPYRLNNEFGESIHSGGPYYAPFTGLYKGGRAEMTREVGAVCGGLSTYGAIAAIANGIPALTMGEPGHCAYTVRPDKTWIPAYSLSWKRGCHWCFYGHQWSNLIVTQNMFSDKESRQKSFQLMTMGDIARKEGAADHAREFYQEALKAQPINLAHWVQYLDWERQQNTLNKQQWQAVSNQIIESYGKDYPEIAWNLLSDKVYPALMPLLTSQQEKSEAILQFHKGLATMTPAVWDFAAALKKQAQLLGNDEEAIRFMITSLPTVHLKSRDYLAPTLIWCTEQLAQFPNLQKSFYDSVASSSAEIGSKIMEQLASSIIKQAERTGDIDSFQAAGRLVKDQFKPKLPQFEPFPGELLTSGGILMLNSTHDRYGPAWQHWGVLESCGGAFHTNNREPKTEVKVIMPRMGELSGLVIVSRQSHINRGDGTIIEVSEDGSDWKQIGTIEKMKRVQRFDLNGKNIRAKYIRITCPKKDYYHLEGILAYGRRLA